MEVTLIVIAAASLLVYIITVLVILNDARGRR